MHSQSYLTVVPTVVDAVRKRPGCRLSMVLCVLLSPLLLCSAFGGDKADYKHYRRGLSTVNFTCENSRFHLEKGKGLVGSAEGGAAGAGLAIVSLERELSPGTYAVSLRVLEAVAMEQQAMARSEKDHGTIRPSHDVLGIAGGAGEDDGMTLLDEPESPAVPEGPPPVRLRITLGTNSGEITFPHGGEEPLHAVTIPCETPFDTLAIDLLSKEKRVVINGVYLTANPRDIALRRETLGIAGKEREMFLDIHTVAIRQSERGVLRTAESPEPSNHIYNGSFEAGSPSSWWCTPYQSQVAVTPAEVVQTDCPHGAAALVMPLMPHVYRRPAVKITVPEPAVEAASSADDISKVFDSDDDFSKMLDSLDEPESLLPSLKPSTVNQALYKSNQALYKSLPLSLSLLHRSLKLRPNSAYHFKAFLRPDTPVTIAAKVETSYGEMVKVGGATKVLPADVWTPVSFAFKTVDDNRGYDLELALTCKVRSEDLSAVPTVALDAVQLSAVAPREGEFIPAASIEVGVTWDVPGKVFHREEGVDFSLAAANGGKAPGMVKARYRVFDYFNALVAEGTVEDWTLASGVSEMRKLPLNLEMTGAFRLLVDGRTVSEGVSSDIPLQEYAFSVLPRPSNPIHGTFGAYSTLTAQPAAILGRTSIRRVVTLSNMNALLSQWGCINPLPQLYVWADDLVANARANGITIVGNLDLARGVPEFAANPSDKKDALGLSKGTRVLAPAQWSRDKAKSLSKSAWLTFVEQVVDHYKHDIQDWLIIDEPYRFMSMPQYAELFKLSAEAIRKADPDARVLMHGAYYPRNLAALEKLGSLELANGIHDYARDAGKGGVLQKVVGRHDLALHTVEYNGQRSIYQTIETTRPNWDTDFMIGFYRSNAATLAVQAIQRMAWAHAETFSRYGAAYPGGEFLQFSGYKSMYEYDGALKPDGVVLAITASLLDGFRGAGQLDLHKKLETYMMETDDRFCIVFRSKVGGKATQFALPAGIQCVDIMGNPVRIAPRRQWLGPDICYAIGPRSALEDTKAMLAGLELDDVYALSGRSELNEKTGQYERHVTVKNLLSDEPIEVWVGCRSSFLSWELERPLGRIAPGQSASTRFGLNAFKGEKSVAQRGEYVYVHACGGSKY